MSNQIQKSNRLINEKSPYLLQHAYNPVEWFPWCEEAFELAKKESKPIFLSIGYSTCHWCHVMEHESFEDITVAELMNDKFISIKVDREERPDIDHVYMSVCQMMTGGGGWPLTIIMTPDKKPFFAGTYFPRENRHGRIGLIDLIDRVNDVWTNQRSEAYNSADKITAYLENREKLTSSEMVDDKTLSEVYGTFKRMYDTKNGGFGTAPKFPTPHNLLFLLRYHLFKGEPDALKMAEHALSSMFRGGIFDHIGNGLHRYSTDPKWLLPHFEKMLYDQANILFALVEVYSLTKNNLYKESAKKIIDYIEKDLLSEEGYFYSAEDADSEGVEGKFYTWEAKEIIDILTKDEFTLFSKAYNISEEGNFGHEASQEKDGSNIPHLTKSLDELASELSISKDELSNNLETIISKLSLVRSKRIRPMRDNKMLTDWNSLMIASLSYAARIFDNKHYLQLAEDATNFISSTMTVESGRLTHVYNESVSDIKGKLDDYAFFIHSQLELYNSTYNVEYLEQAVSITEIVISDFWDDKEKGFFLTSVEDEELITRPKTFYDSAIPSGNSVMAFNLTRLYRITADEKYNKLAENIIKSASAQIKQNNMSFSFMLLSVLYNLSSTKELIVVDSRDEMDYEKLSVALAEKHSPYLTTIVLNDKNKDSLTKIAPYLVDYTVSPQETKYYLCENYNCDLPVDDLKYVLGKF